MIIERNNWSKNFPKWFQEILDKSDIVDFRYPLKGVGVWLPYGFKLRNHVLGILRRLLDTSGHDEVLFPLMITQNALKKESDHIQSFEEQVF